MYVSGEEYPQPLGDRTFYVDGIEFDAGPPRSFPERNRMHHYPMSRTVNRRVGRVYGHAIEIVKRVVDDPQNIDRFELFNTSLHVFRAAPDEPTAVLGEVSAYIYLKRRGYIVSLGRGARSLMLRMHSLVPSIARIDRDRAISMIFARASNGDHNLYRILALVYSYLKKSGLSTSTHIMAYLSMRIASAVTSIPVSIMVRRSGIRISSSVSTIRRYMERIGAVKTPTNTGSVLPKPLCEYLSQNGIGVPKYITCADKNGGSVLKAPPQ